MTRFESVGSEGAWDSSEGAWDSSEGAWDSSEGAWDSSEGAWDSSEGAWDSEAVWDRNSRAEAERRARARRLALARQRAAAARPPSRQAAAQVPSRTVTPRQTIAAIRELDLQTKVSNDSLQQAMDRANRRAGRATYAAIASLAVDQALDSFGGDLASHDFVRAGLRSAPLLLLAPERKRRGFEGFILDPRVIGFTGVVAIVAAGKIHHRDAGVAHIRILESKVTGAGTLSAVAVDKDGAVVIEPITFQSTNPAVLTVNPDGTFTANSAGQVFVIASAGGHSEVHAVTVR